LLLPGQPLPLPSSQPSPIPGPGTYQRANHILSSTVGYLRTTLPPPPPPTQPRPTKQGQSDHHPTTVSVQRPQNTFVVPRPDSVVIARVTRVTPRQAHLSILIVDGQPCGSSSQSTGGAANHAAGEGEGTDFQGIVRSQDVRNTEKDKVRMADCFRPGDIVRATVISLGDARSYYLSTASNHLGVIYATSSSSSSANANAGPGWDSVGEPMKPISWIEMIDPSNGRIEKRKCAKPDFV
ncbi:hypothetical protein IE53DRAFT_293056, partial [Violaceomyces palustris]